MATLAETRNALVGKRMTIDNGWTGYRRQFTVGDVCKDDRNVWIYDNHGAEGTIIPIEHAECLMQVGACTIETETQDVPYEIVIIIR